MRVAAVIGYDDDDFFGMKMVSPAEIKAFSDSNAGKDILFMINSPGGIVSQGAEIASLIQLHDGKTTALVTGQAASCASVMAAACNEVVMMPASINMIHGPWGIVLGNATDLREAAAQMDVEGAGLGNVYKSRMDADLVDSLLGDGKDHFFGPEACVKNGFADRVWKAEEETKRREDEDPGNDEKESEGSNDAAEEKKRAEHRSRMHALAMQRAQFAALELVDDGGLSK